MSSTSLSPSSFHDSSSSKPINPPSASAHHKPGAWSYATTKVPAWALPSTGPSSSQTQAGPLFDNAPYNTQPTSESTAMPPTLVSDPMKRSRKRRYLLPEEQGAIKHTTNRLSELLGSDERLTLQPDVNRPFSDPSDVLARLLPYHIWQQPIDDIRTISHDSFYTGQPKSRGGAGQTDVVDTKFALSCFERKRKLDVAFKRILRQPGRRSAPNDILYHLEHHALDTERNDNTSLTYELRNTRAEFDTMERQKKTRALTPARTPSQAPLTTQTATHPSYSTYGYTQSTPYQYAYPQYAPAASGTQPINASAHSTHTTSASTSSQLAQPPTPSAIPVQLPVSYLPALTRLGIIPTTASSVAAGAPRPACVITSASADGTILSLEINVGMLQPAQVNGIAIVLTSLVNSRTSAVAAAPPTATSSSEIENQATGQRGGAQS